MDNCVIILMLNKKLVPLSFSQGLDTKRDKKQQLFGQLRVAENVVFETLDSARKRNGYDNLMLQTTSGQVVSNAEFLAKYKQELLAFSDDTLYGYSTSLNKVESKGALYSVFPTTLPVTNNSYNNVDVTMHVVAGLKVFAYTNTITSEVRYAVQDAVSGAMLVTDSVVASNAKLPIVQAIQNKVYIFYASGNNLFFKTFDASVPSVLSAQKTFSTNLSNPNSNFDVANLNDRLLVVYRSTNALLRLQFRTVRANDIPSAALTFNEDPSASIFVRTDSSGNVIFAWSDGTQVKYMVYSSNLSIQRVAPTVVETIANAVKIAVSEHGMGSYVVYYALSAAPTYNYLIRKNTATVTGTVGTAAQFVRSLSLASKFFTVNSKSYVLCSYESPAQSTFFVLDESAVIVSKIAPGYAGGHIDSAVLPDVQVQDSTASIPSIYKTKLAAENGEFFSLTGVQSTTLDYSDSNRYSNATLGNNLLISGGLLQQYDGQKAVEHSFNVYPELPTLTALTTGTANNWPSLAMENTNSPSDTYGYLAVYRWTDAQGQEHRSAPSEIANIHLSQSSSQVGVQLTIPTLRLSQKQNVVVEIYRTELNGTLFYLTNSVTIPFFNNPASDTVTFIDGKPDSALISGRLLYTTGGVLDNVAGPSAKILATHTASKRIFLAGLENPYSVQYSKVTQDAQPVEFNDALTIAIDPVGGPITAMSSMDEKLVIFAEDAIFFMSGAGPNNTGEQNSFTNIERVSTDVGCIAPRSVVLTPDGLMFKSRKGIYLLSRSLQLTYLGSPVELYNSLTISSAKVVSELNQVRFTATNGDCLTYNYVYKFWATFTNHKAQSAEVVGNDYYYLRLNGDVYKENRTSYSDAGSPIKMRLEIGWISFAIIQGYARIYKLMFLGDWLSAHNLLIKVAYDFKEIWAQQVTVSPTVGQFEATAYGDDSPYGEPIDKPYGGTANSYQGRINFKQQKCESIKLSIEDEQENAGPGFSLSNITFEVGGKAGLFKVAKAKKFAMK